MIFIFLLFFCISIYAGEKSNTNNDSNAIDVVAKKNILDEKDYRRSLERRYKNFNVQCAKDPSLGEKIIKEFIKDTDKSNMGSWDPNCSFFYNYSVLYYKKKIKGEQEYKNNLVSRLTTQDGKRFLIGDDTQSNFPQKTIKKSQSLKEQGSKRFLAKQLGSIITKKT